MTKLIAKLLCAAAPVAVAIPLLAAGAVPIGKAEDVGFSTERLGRVKEAVQRRAVYPEP